LGLGIGGFIDRTRGIYDASLAPVYYRYGGSLSNDKYYNKLDAFNLYTGDYVTCCDKLPFTNLHDTSCAVVREGYKSTLIVTGGQYFGQDIFDDTAVQNKTYFYAPWINSRYHHQSSEQFGDDSTQHKQPFIPSRPRSSRPRSSTTDLDLPQTDDKNANPVSRQFVTNDMDFNNVATRSSSRSVSHVYRNRKTARNGNSKINNNSPSTTNDTNHTQTYPDLNGFSSASRSESQSPEFLMNTTLTSDGTMGSSTNSSTLFQTKINEKREGIVYDHWINGPAMFTPRASHSCIAWDEHIVFAFGGFGVHGRRIDSVEMLRMDKFRRFEDLHKLRWRKCEPMSEPKSNLVLIHWKPKTCIVGVGSGSKIVESYDPYKDRWRDLPPLNTPQVSNKSCRFYYDNRNTNCLMFLKFRNGVIKDVEYLDERMKRRKWIEVKQEYVDLFNAQYQGGGCGYLKDIQTFCL